MKRNRKKILKADAASMNTKTTCAFIAIAVALMLTVGISMARQTQEQTVLNSISDEKTVEIGEVCPCSQIHQGEMRTTDSDIDLCQYLNDGYESFIELTMDEALTDWCFFGGSSSFPHEQSESTQYDGQSESTQQSSSQEYDISGVEVFLELLQGSGNGDGEQSSGIFDIVSQLDDGLSTDIILQDDGVEASPGIVTYETTAEEVRAMAEAVHEWCNGGPAPPCDPGDWGLGEAMAKCLAETLIAASVPYYIIATVIWLPFLRICITADIYLTIRHQLQEYGVDIVEIYWACVDFYTGGGW